MSRLACSLLYSLLCYLVQPLIWLRLAWRGYRQPGYLRQIGERYGFYAGRPPTPPTPLFWLHAVSVGETRAAEPLIEALLAEYPEHSLLLTHMTPTGRAVGVELIGKHGPRLSQAYLPYDLPGACARFLGHFKPDIGLLMETEIWPNLIAAARARGLPLLLVNARLSAGSQRAYRRFLPLIRPAVKKLAAVAAQTPADASRLESIGAQHVRVTGNLKFDVTPAAEKLRLGGHWRQALGERPVWLAASTREGEEALILDAFARLGPSGALLLLVPRHPQRFGEVAALIEERQLLFCSRGSRLPTPETRVWLGDSMGEMPAYFALADLALIGGTLLPFGGQNLIEAAACACPVLVGPHTYNFAQAAEDALACGAARRVADAADAARTAQGLLADRAALAAMRQAALEFSQAHRGATARTIAVIKEILD
ncbi:MAG: lipid IV(A) 3-deoxy-D-manno-octulosonic acid transferase [Candidatus Accumulibacter sp.]|jgi:3-deoxy-D-manno-octulosonic-acid transferase|nr:lipid IV(A) 3-deoxy-D-manno-octulosonic acid transferase [Accumulibacter sp.]